MGEMKRATAREDEDRVRERFASTIAICASIIAAARLAKEEKLQPSPRLLYVISESIGLAETILKRVLGR